MKMGNVRSLSPQNVADSFETVPSPHGAKREAGLFDKSVSTDFVIVADVITYLMSRRLQKVGLRTKNYVLASGKLVGIMDH
jgi:adenosylcobinamide amidohydrolase